MLPHHLPLALGAWPCSGTQRGWKGEHPQVLAQIHSTDLAGSAATTPTQHFTRVAVYRDLPRATEAWPALSPRGPQ